MSRSSVLASLASQDVSASEFDKLDADNGSDYQGQIDLKSPLASPTFTGSITTPEIRSGSTLTIDPAAVGDNTGLVLLKGNLQVDGTSTTINSTTLTVDDLNLTLASGAADSAAANGAGITIDGASATMTYTHSTTSFDFNKPVNAINTAQITGAEGTSASLYLVADEGDDNGDGWRINSNQDVNDLTISNNTSGSYVDKLTVKSSGEVGIGTTAPTTILHLNGDSPGIKIEEDTDNDYMLIDVVQGGRARIGMNDTRVLTIQENGGRVGIGTTASGNQLTVVTTDYADSNATYPYTGATLHLKTTANQSGRGCGIVFSDGQEDKGFITMNGQGGRAGDLRFYTRASGGTVGFAMRIASNGTVYTTGGTVSNISDIRIKKDVVDLTDGLDIVNQLKPRKFKFNGKNPMAVNDGETHYGFVADEVLSVASQYVELTTDNIDGERLDDVKTISTGKMIPMLVNAVKELSAEVTALKSAG